MPLTKSRGNMYPWVTHTHSHLGGQCPHKCRYCYVQAIALRYGDSRYKGDLRLIEDEFQVHYGSGRTIFIEHCNDLWAHGVPDDWVAAVLSHCRAFPDNEYVFQTKNPDGLCAWLSKLPPRRLLGCTIETVDSQIASGVSQAPLPWMRFNAMNWLRRLRERLFVTVEPILDGDMATLAAWCHMINPEFVNVGADSKGSGLPEPTGEKIAELLLALKSYGIPIRRKHNLERLLSKRTLPDLRRCRVCACTDEDCSGCMQRTGKPCHWVSEDLCSACADGFNALIRVKRSGSDNIASVRVGGLTYRGSCTASEVGACERAAQKAAAAVHATTWRVERYKTLSIKAGRAALLLEFGGPANKEVSVER